MGLTRGGTRSRAPAGGPGKLGHEVVSGRGLCWETPKRAYTLVLAAPGLFMPWGGPDNVGVTEACSFHLDVS